MPDEGKIIKPDRPMICEIDLEEEATATVIESSAPTVTGLPTRAEDEAEAPKQIGYVNLLQGKGTNALARINSKSFAPVHDLLNKKLGSTEANGVKIITDDITAKLDGNALRIYDILMMKMTASLPLSKTATIESIDRARHVKLAVTEYMEICGKSDRKAAREQLNEGINALYSVSLEWDQQFFDVAEGNTKPTYHTKRWRTRVLDGTGSDLDTPVKNGEADLYFSMNLAKYLTQASVMPHSMALFKINMKKHPNAYYVGREMEEHHNMNLDKPNENRIAVTTLVRNTPGIPSYEEVMSGSKKVKEKIIDRLEETALLPLERNYGFLENWFYCNSGGEPITEKQLEAYSYDEWSTWLVEFKINDYPAQEQKRLHRAEAQEAARKNKEKKKKKEKSGK